MVGSILTYVQLISYLDPLQRIPDPQKCTIVFAPSQSTTGSNAQFEVHLIDAHGEPCHLTSDIKVTAQLTSLVDGSITDTTLESHTKALCTLSYKPTQRGRHHLTISVNGEAVINSPFSRFVYHPPAQLSHRVRVIMRLVDPKGITVLTTRKDQLLVAEKHIISIRDIHGKLIRKIGPLSDGFRTVNFDPTGVAVSRDAVIFVTDAYTDRLLKVNCNGKLLKATGSQGSDRGQFFRPYGIISISDKVFVCDTGNDRVQIFNTNLEFLSFFGTKGCNEGKFYDPCDIAADKDSCLYVADCGNNRVQVFSQNGLYLRSFGQGRLHEPVGIHVHNEHVYIVGWTNRLVSVFTTSGDFTSSFDVPSSFKGRRHGCFRGITMDRDGYLYVCGIHTESDADSFSCDVY